MKQAELLTGYCGAPFTYILCQLPKDSCFLRQSICFEANSAAKAARKYRLYSTTEHSVFTESKVESQS